MRRWEQGDKERSPVASWVKLQFHGVALSQVCHLPLGVGAAVGLRVGDLVGTRVGTLVGLLVGA